MTGFVSLFVLLGKSGGLGGRICAVPVSDDSGYSMRQYSAGYGVDTDSCGYCRKGSTKVLKYVKDYIFTCFFLTIAL